MAEADKLETAGRTPGGAAPRTDTGSRGLVLAWCLWLLGSWAVARWLDSSGPVVRWMVLAALSGLMLLWPAFRLSQDYPVAQGYGSTASGPTAMPPGRVLLDWLSLNIVFQAVVWPLHVTAGWSVSQTLLLDAAVASWSLVTALLIAWGGRHRIGTQRTWAMVLCLLLVAGEPLVMVLMNNATWHMRVSPIETIWVLTGPAGSWSADPWIERVAAVAAAAIWGWGVLAIFNRRG